MASVASTLILWLIIFFVRFTGYCHGALQVGFYRGKCGINDVEIIVAGVVVSRFFRDPTIVAALLRLHFHDCFVGGCDASILLDGMNTEKKAVANVRVRGYDIIDQAKAAVERACPGVVSCADLIAIATRDAVFLSGGGRYNMPTGRRDGFFSRAQNVSSIPGPSDSVSQAVFQFGRRGLPPKDMVLLLGAHSVGVAHCAFVKNRLYNFRDSGRPDPSMPLFLANFLRSRCPRNSTRDSFVNLDQNPISSFSLDNSYYRNLLQGGGILEIDQKLALNPSTRRIVRELANTLDFPRQFGNAMIKMGAIEVLTGNQGEIRRSCHSTNRPL
ncbi:hypothetical protein ACFE04_004529 [Oxalis oulophora]